MDTLRGFFRKLNLQNRILLITVTILLFWGLFCFVSFRWVVLDLLTRQVFEKYQTLAKVAAEAMAPMLMEGDLEAMARLIKKVQQGDDCLQYVVAVDSKGRPLERASKESSLRPQKGSLAAVGPALRTRTIPTANGSGDNAIQEISFPITEGDEVLGHIQLGILDRAFQRHIKSLQPIFLGAMGCLILVSSLFSLRFSDDITRPLARLTQLSDEISQGNLEVDINFGKHVNCWEIKHCRQTSCAAYENREVQCWYVDGTPCEGYEPRFPQKLGQCRRCEVYQAHRGDEIVQLADSFKHMAYKLKTSQNDLKNAYNLQRHLIQSSFNGIIASDVHGKILIFNRVAEKLTDFNEQEVVGKKTWRNFFYPDLLGEIHKPLLGDGSTVLQGFSPRESVIFKRDGSFIPILVGGVSLTHKEQEVGHVVFFLDIREIKRLRNDLIQSERMAAVGQTVASISHSIKNILDGLRGGIFIYNHGKDENDSSKKRTGLDMIEKNIDIISELVVDLLNYSKERQLDLQRYDPNKLIKEVAAIMGRKAESRQIELFCQGSKQIDEVVLDPFAMNQCLVNLVSNAVDAIPPDQSGRIVITAFREGNNRIGFKVKDNGTGMNRDTHEKILKGMFSTKGSKGTGLGLLVVQKIVGEHQGILEVVSEKGKGSEFTVYLPHIPSLNPGSEQVLATDQEKSLT